MLLYKPESLELLRQRIDLAEVISSHIELHRAGASYKALCPFHEEKSPSFVISKGDKHYHCFGCGAHGDAIAFLMGHLKLSFVEAVESLAERFQVPLEKLTQGEEVKSSNKLLLRQVLDKASRIYHYALLHSEEAVSALHYLQERGMDKAFIELFQIGYAPKGGQFLQPVLHADGFSDDILDQAGLISSSRRKDFFSERITFPIRDAMGSVIGFSARKFKEETFGGKYINTPETALFKKSHILFGLSYSRQRIAKERKAIIVEGQIDTLRLIHAGFNYTVSGQGTAFGEDHVKELLKLGVHHIFLALDGDEAGHEASVKIGNLFQKKGVGVFLLALPIGSDPDSFIRKEGSSAFMKLLEEREDYLSFLVKHFSRHFDTNTPSGKNELVKKIARMIRSWEQPFMVFESLRKLAALTHLPESLLGLNGSTTSSSYIRKSEKIASIDIDPHRIIETDLLRFLFLAGESHPNLIKMAQDNLTQEHFYVPVCRRLYLLYMKAFIENKPRDFLSIAALSNDREDQEFFTEILGKKINLHKAEEGMQATVKGMLEKEWMRKRDEIQKKIQNCVASDEELTALVKAFDVLKKPPQVIRDFSNSPYAN